jgi:biphenyl 2,3-dioxygenase ferredoxin subunit
MNQTTCRQIGICNRADVEPGKAIKIEKEGLTLAVYNLDGEILVTDDLCTHGPGSLSEGCIKGDTVTCDFHDGAFNIRTGEAVVAPCMIPVKTYRTLVDAEGNVSIEV